MAKALEIYCSDLTPLQQAAIKRIHEYQQELKEKYGMYVKSAIELEFAVDNAQGQSVPHIIDLERARKYLQQQRLPFFERLDYEHRFPSGMPMNSSQYEITLSDQAKSGAYAIDKFSPADVAGTTVQFKTQTLPQLLLAASSLSSNTPTRELRPNFRATPFLNDAQLSSEDPSKKYTTTSALHINVSLYDADGLNLFAESPELLNQCALSLVQAQKDAAVSMVPDKYSHARLMIGKHNLNGSVPGGLGIRDNKKCIDDKYSSVRRRVHYSARTNTSRIENRLPGADADPIVAMAVTLAALVDSVRHHVHPAQPGMETSPSHERINNRFMVDKPNSDALAQTHEIPSDHKDMVKQFSSSKHMRELLGAELYDAIAQACSPAQECTR